MIRRSNMIRLYYNDEINIISLSDNVLNYEVVLL